MQELPTLTHLLKVLQQVPYLASKNLYRVAAHFLEMEPQQILQFCATLEAAKKKLKKCLLKKSALSLRLNRKKEGKKRLWKKSV